MEDSLLPNFYHEGKRTRSRAPREAAPTLICLVRHHDRARTYRNHLVHALYRLLEPIRLIRKGLQPKGLCLRLIPTGEMDPKFPLPCFAEAADRGNLGRTTTQMISRLDRLRASPACVVGAGFRFQG